MTLASELAMVAAVLASRRGPSAREAVAEQLVQMRDMEVAQAALRVGELAPDFELPDVDSGRIVALTALLDRGPVVVNFVRGFWCPYCNLQMRALARAEPAIAARGATLLAITVQPLEAALNGLAVDPLPYRLLYDQGARAAALFGLTFPIVPALARIYELAGIPTAVDAYAQKVLPLTASYVIARDGTVAYAYVDVDHTRRAEPDALIAAVESLAATARS
ncbi:MAG: AhpC/TSA family protein [Alphaproteobacteria bacterium]|nr:AhpC/TSA family protein [Alphaproteobacteria bacterium]